MGLSKGWVYLAGLRVCTPMAKKAHDCIQFKQPARFEAFVGCRCIVGGAALGVARRRIGGRERMFLITGDPGIGKISAIWHLAAHATAQAMCIHLGTAAGTVGAAFARDGADTWSRSPTQGGVDSHALIERGRKARARL